MSRPSLRDQIKQRPVQQDKFVGLVEKRPIDPKNAVEDDRTIRSSSLNAPFGQQSSAASFARQSAGVKAAGNKTFDRLYVQARRTGSLNMENMNLTEFPAQVCALYDESSITSEEKFWECVDLTSLNMQHNAITAIPSNITNLVHLQVILFGHNQLKSLPNELFALELLKKLDLSHNHLAHLPDQLGALQSLVELNVSHNSLVTFPDSLCDLQRLEILTAEHNLLENLPLDIGELRQLLRVNLNSNKLIGLPPSFSQCIRLAHLEVKQNKLQSDVASSAPSSNRRPTAATTSRPPPITGVPSLRQMKDLILLDLSENQLSRLPELPTSSKLNQVFFGFNSITDCRALTACPGLVSIDLHNNRIEVFPSELGRPDSAIKFLDLSNNELGDIPGELGLIRSLNKLLVDGNPLRKFPRGKLQSGGGSIEAFKKYLITRIDANVLAQIGGEEAEEASGTSGTTHSMNPNLEFCLREGAASQTINLAKLTPVLTAFPTSIFTLPSIQEIQVLDISNQRIPDAEIPAQLSLLKRLIIFRGNNLAWKTLPLQLCSLLQLQELELSGNQLTDLPDNMRVFQVLKRLDLNKNQFKVFPKVLQHLASHLTHLSLANNRLTKLPDDLCLWFQDTLESLDLSTNGLTSLPEGWRWMSPRFEYLNIENNQLASVPLELGLLNGLRTLLLNGNPQRTVLYQVIAKGTPAILSTLKNKIPVDSPLLDPNASRPRPPTPEDPDMIHLDTTEYFASKKQQQQRPSQQQGYGGGMSSFNARSSSTSSKFGAPSSRSSSNYPDHDEPYDDRSPSAADRQSQPQSQSYRDTYSTDVPRGRSNQLQYDDRREPSSYDNRGYGPSSYDRNPPSRADSSYDSRSSHQQPSRQPPSSSAAYRTTDPSTLDRDYPSNFNSRSQQPPQQRFQDSNYDRREPFGHESNVDPARTSAAAPSSIATRGPPPSSSSSSTTSNLTQLQASIQRLTNELESNLSLGSLQKLQLKKELAGMKAELNRSQQRR